MTAVEFNFQVSGLQDHLRNFAQSLTLSTDDSKDLVQDTILKAFRYREKFVDPANLKAWLFTIMTNTFINDYRRKKRSNVVAENAVQFQYSPSESTPPCTIDWCCTGATINSTFSII